MDKKRLPLGIQSFETMIEKNHIYVDKTAYIYKMVDEGMFYFLARPRRFGKSLTVSTMAALFEGRKELFKRLWVENSAWEWEKHPVVKIDFNGIKSTNAEALEKSLLIRLDEIAEQFIETTNAILSAIPYTQHEKQGESFYYTVFYLMVAASGVLVLTEPLSSKGRTDIAVEFKDKVYVIELKCNQPATAAIEQIRDKGYHKKYVQSGRAIYLLGINFDTTRREITDWRKEDV